MSKCPICLEPVDIATGIKQGCGHRTHGFCMDQDNPNFDKCASCRGEVDLTKEPPSKSGRDYISNPQPPGKLDKLRKKASRLLSRATIKDSEDPHFLLSHGPTQCPIDWLIREKGLGLQRMLEEGVTIEDFLDNNYDWNHLQTFTDLNHTKVGAQRVKDALFALGTHAEHLRDSLPYEEMKVSLQISPKDMVGLFGLHFPATGGSIIVEGGRNQYAWDAQDLVAMGFTQKDLIGAGIKYLEQYADLEPTDELEDAMKITDRFVAGLPSLVQPTVQREEPQPRTRAKFLDEEIVSPTAKRQETLRAPRLKEIVEPVKRERRLHGLRKKN